MKIHRDLELFVQSSIEDSKAFAQIFSLEDTIEFVDRIQKAYEEERPILLVYRTPFGHRQFCGFVDHIEPDDRTIHLYNGSMKRKVDLGTMITLELV